MKLKRFVAKDMRTALTLVKEELGADAIIMSNKRIASGVEIVAGIENLPQPKLSTTANAAAASVDNNAGAPKVNAPKPERERRLIGGKNQAYAKSLIEILERQQTMSQEQGARLINDIDKANAANAARANAANAAKVPQARLVSQGEGQPASAGGIKPNMQGGPGAIAQGRPASAQGSMGASGVSASGMGAGAGMGTGTMAQGIQGRQEGQGECLAQANRTMTPGRMIEAKTVPQGPMMRSPYGNVPEPQGAIQITAEQAAAVAAKTKAAAAAAGFATSKSQAATLTNSANAHLLEPRDEFDVDELGQQLSPGVFQSYSQDARIAESRLGDDSVNVMSSESFEVSEISPQRTASIPGAASLVNPISSIYGDDDDMANDPSKKAGPSTIDPSLDEDADLFKTPPLPLSQQREFKNFFVKSKARQEKEDYESREGIDSYRGAPEPNVRQDLEKMRSEVENIRKLLQFELAGLMQDNRSRTEPVKAMIIKLLHSVGFSDRVSDLLVKNLPAEATFNTAWRSIVQVLERSIVVGDDEIISQGGIVTLIGPAGVGKTTTLAKLAARFVMRYGPQRVAIVTADHYRIGAVEQIKTYGRIMGCATFAVKNLSELPQLLYTMSDKSLILVDTAGVGFKDERFGAQLSQLKLQSSLKLKHYLVLPCTAQRKVLQHAYDHFSIVGLTGLILTKLDECQNLGDALSLCIDMNLPISYITDGQRVPEDIDVPHPNELARRALSSIEDDMAQKAIKA